MFHPTQKLAASSIINDEELVKKREEIRDRLLKSEEVVFTHKGELESKYQKDPKKKGTEIPLGKLAQIFRSRKKGDARFLSII